MAVTLKELERLNEKRDKGVWESYSAVCCSDMGGVETPSYRTCPANVGIRHPMTIENAEFIAEAANAMTALLAIVRAANDFRKSATCERRAASLEALDEALAKVDFDSDPSE